LGLAYTYYVGVFDGDASVRKPSLVLAGCSVQSRGVFAIGQSIESRGKFLMTSVCCVAW